MRPRIVNSVWGFWVNIKNIETMSILEIFVIIAVTPAILLMFYGLYVHEQWKKFRRFLKKGDLVDKYLGEERKTYLVESVGEVFCSVINEDTGGKIMVPRSDIMPNFWFNYAPEYLIEKDLTCNQLLDILSEVKIDSMTPELSRIRLELKEVKRSRAKGGLIKIASSKYILNLINSGGRSAAE